MNKIVLITGSCGLIGSEATKFYLDQGYKVLGIDNNMRREFFGQQGSTDRIRAILEKNKNYRHYHADIRDASYIHDIFSIHKDKICLIIHCCSQPSHDWSAKDPVTDFTINADGTLNILEATRKYCQDAVFIFTSTNKVYGDTPNNLPLVECDTRYTIDSTHKYSKGIDESMSIDASKHSLFGVSKAAADLLVQEYGRYFGMKTVCFRAGCLTGQNHSSVELHGFLSYLIKCIVNEKKYTVYGYKGKQVRDNIDSRDLISAFHEFYLNPRSGEVYNIGGGLHSNCSIYEAINIISKCSNKKAIIGYVEDHRSGDHKWYISDVSKFMSHYPKWQQKYYIDAIIDDIVQAELNK